MISVLFFTGLQGWEGVISPAKVWATKRSKNVKIRIIFKQNNYTFCNEKMSHFRSLFCIKTKCLQVEFCSMRLIHYLALINVCYSKYWREIRKKKKQDLLVLSLISICVLKIILLNLCIRRVFIIFQKLLHTLFAASLVYQTSGIESFLQLQYGLSYDCWSQLVQLNYFISFITTQHQIWRK